MEIRSTDLNWPRKRGLRSTYFRKLRRPGPALPLRRLPGEALTLEESIVMQTKRLIIASRYKPERLLCSLQHFHSQSFYHYLIYSYAYQYLLWRQNDVNDSF